MLRAILRWFRARARPRPAALPPLTDVRVTLATDPDEPPATWNVEWLALGIFAQTLLVNGTPDQSHDPWGTWLQLGAQDRDDLRRVAWRVIRRLPAMPVFPVECVGGWVGFPPRAA